MSFNVIARLMNIPDHHRNCYPSLCPVILSAAKDLSAAAHRSFAALRMTKGSDRGQDVPDLDCQCSLGRVTGSVKVNVLPWPSVLSALIRPPCASTTWRAIASPSPLPPLSQLSQLFPLARLPDLLKSAFDLARFTL